MTVYLSLFRLQQHHQGNLSLSSHLELVSVLGLAAQYRVQSREDTIGQDEMSVPCGSIINEQPDDKLATKLITFPYSSISVSPHYQCTWQVVVAVCVHTSTPSKIPHNNILPFINYNFRLPRRWCTQSVSLIRHYCIILHQTILCCIIYLRYFH